MISDLRLFPEAASTMAGPVDELYWFLTSVSAFFTILIGSLILAFAIRYRRRRVRSKNEIPAMGRGEHKAEAGFLGLELTWTIIPFVLAMVMFFWSAKIYVALREAPADALEVFAVGKQWMWKMQHLEGRREINQLHVPVGRPVKVTLTSEDVIHSFFVPAFRVKQDAVPGLYTDLWFEATKPGRYHLFCTEYCGSQHSGMIGEIVAMEPADYQAWLSGREPGEPQLTMAEAGELLFAELGCASCHQESDTGRGPSLAGLAGSVVELSDGTRTLADAEYLRESILQPQKAVASGYQPIMPTFQGLIGEDQVLELIAYIESLATATEPAEAQDPAAEPAEADAPPDMAYGGDEPAAVAVARSETEGETWRP